MLRKVGFISALMLAVPTFANAWTITAKVGSGAGTITSDSAAGTVARTATDRTAIAGYFKVANTDADQVISILPAAGYKVSSVVIDGVAKPVAASYTVLAGAPIVNHTVAVYYTAETFKASVTQAAGGAVSIQALTPAGAPIGAISTKEIANLKAGAKVRIKAAPNADYKLVTVAGFAAKAGLYAGEADYQDVVVGGDVNYTATFAMVPNVKAGIWTNNLNATVGTPVTVKATAIANGTVSYAFSATGGSITSSGATATYTPTTAGAQTVTVVATNGTATDTKVLNFTVETPAQNGTNVCLGCHTTRNPATVTAFNAGTHGGTFTPGTLACDSCHSQAAGHPYQKEGFVEPGQTTTGVPTAAGFAGSAKCGSCHTDKYNGWVETFHNKPLKTIAEQGEKIFVNDSNGNGKNDFIDGLDFNTDAATPYLQSGQPWGAMKALGNAPKLSYDGSGRYFISIAGIKYEIFRTQGGNGKWKQRYHTKIGNAYYILPVQFNENTKKYEAYNNNNWYDTDTANGITATNLPIITAGTSNTDPVTIAQVAAKLLKGGVASNVKGPSYGSWDNRCAACHQTGVAIEFKDVGAGVQEVVASSTELNVGCESCHGAGAAHAAAPSKTNIENPALWATNVGAKNYYRANEVCGQCHSRTEGFGHFSAAVGKVKAGIEAPSAEIHDAGAGKVEAVSYLVGGKLLDYIEQIIPGVFGTKTTIAYDDRTGAANEPAKIMVTYPGGSDKHHQQWHDMELGAHGAISQMTSNKGVTCFSCHDPHKPNSGNIRTSATVGGQTIATASTDNTLCLTCHVAEGVSDKKIGSLTASELKGNVEAVKDAVYDHLVAKAGYPEANRASWKAKYLQSVQKNGTSATFGLAIYKVGQCISCHMPYTAKSGVRASVSTANGSFPAGTANGRAQGDIRNHSFKPIFFGLQSSAVKPAGSNATMTTACSACHVVKL